MCITQAEMFGQEYEEAKLKGLENKTKKWSIQYNNYMNSQLKKRERKRMLS